MRHTVVPPAASVCEFPKGELGSPTDAHPHTATEAEAFRADA
jgi:hypothetical protein